MAAGTLGEFWILIAIVILGLVSIRILWTMREAARTDADRQTNVAEEILEAVVSIRDNVHGMAHPAKFADLEVNVSLIKDAVRDLRADVQMVETAVNVESIRT